MVSACKQYITEEGHVRVWDVPPTTLLQRLDACKMLYQCYQECFHQRKQHVHSSSRPFEISEMYVFGKFVSFCRRLDQIQDLVNTIKHFSVLQQSHIEGIDAFATRFNHLISAFKKKPYNPLDHRKMEFAVDFGEFQRQVTELEEQLCSFVTASFSQVDSCMQSLQLLKR